MLFESTSLDRKIQGLKMLCGIFDKINMNTYKYITSEKMVINSIDNIH